MTNTCSTAEPCRLSAHASAKSCCIAPSGICGPPDPPPAAEDRERARPPPPSEPCQEPLAVDDHAGDLAVADDPAVRLLGDDAEAQQSPVDVRESRRHPDCTANRRRLQVLYRHSRADARRARVERLL